MNNKKVILMVVILIFVLILGIILYRYKKESTKSTESPILTMVTSNGTSCYTITYYKKHATYKVDIGGIAGMSYGKEKTILYSQKIDFKQLKNEIENITRNISGGTVKIIVNNKEIYANIGDAIINKLFKIININNIEDLI